MAAKTELLQGTLDLLILKVVAQGPLHDTELLKQILLASREMLEVRQGSLLGVAPVAEKKGC